MYIARFSYELRPVDRQKAVELIRREVEAAGKNGLSARLLIPLTRGQGAPALQFELEIASLDELDAFRHSGVRSPRETGKWMHELSEVLISPPQVEILRVDEKE